MKLKNKADLRDTLILLLVFLVVAVTLFFFFEGGFSALANTADDEACRLSVFAQAKLRSSITGDSPIREKCPPHDIEFFQKKVEKDDKKILIKIQDETPGYNFDALNDDIVNDVVAEEMRNCWGKMGKGDLYVFDRSFSGSKKVCLRCAEIEFNADIKYQTFSGLPEYLDNEMPNQGNNEKLTYKQYLIKEYTGISWTIWPPNVWFEQESLQLNEKATFDTSKEYIIFLRAFKEPLGSNIDDRYFIFVDEREKVLDKSVCDILIN
ncbi:hypothetical protein CMO93_03260 [Candidatus Woesearchaeota archaeon]|nr:hypothetical protein [Candidatus Woesearchaeota archaeon]|tara:strand:+ start:3164 stop:3958 length:795 start_codon:yes stop_codon:yes gene_type:complete